MEEFERHSHRNDILFEKNDEPIRIVLKFRDNYARNKNKININKVKQFLSEGQRVCFFQKSKKKREEEKNDPHKIIIPVIVTKETIELIVVLHSSIRDKFEVVYSYYVDDIKVLDIQPEENEFTIKENCEIKLFSDRCKGTDDEKFKNLYKRIENLQIPIIKYEIEKEKEKKIWNNYVNALKEIVKQKEQVWKIQSINTEHIKKNV